MGNTNTVEYRAPESATFNLTDHSQSDTVQYTHLDVEDAKEYAKVIKYMDNVQTDIQNFNKNQEKKIQEFIKKNGQNAYLDIVKEDKYHELMVKRFKNYKLSDEELKNLINNKILIKQIDSEKTFGNIYQELCSNSMPIFITSDSILHAFHKIYEPMLRDLEITRCIPELFSICNSIVESIQKIECTDLYTQTILEKLELVFLIPVILMSLNHELKENITLTTMPSNAVSKDKIMEAINSNTSISKNTYQRYSLLNDQKLKSFATYYEFTELEACNSIIHNDTVAKYYTEYIMPDINTSSIKYVYTNENTVLSVLQMIGGYNFDLNIYGNINTSLLKPKGYYLENSKLSNYFTALSWICNYTINLNNDNSIIEAFMLCKIMEQHKHIIEKFTNLINKINGTSDTEFTFNTLLPEINKILVTMGLLSAQSLEKCLGYIVLNKDIIIEKFLATKNFNKFNIMDHVKQLDTIVIENMIDDKFIDDTGKTPLRKFPSVYDLVYTIFDNDTCYTNLKDRMDTISILNRDGYQYTNHLKNIRKNYNINNYNNNSLYLQHLKLIKSLSSNTCSEGNKEMMKERCLEPFDKDAWYKKQVNTQIGSYSEFKYDNINNLSVGSHYQLNKNIAKPSEIMVEPCLTFWTELLNTIIMIKNVINDPENKYYNKLNKFESIVNKLIKITNMYISKKVVDISIIDELKLIMLNKEYDAIYNGWYAGLFMESDDVHKYSPECASIFSAPQDSRGLKGDVHIGTGSVQTMYIIINNTVYMGPVYSIYESISF
jgi:hypothetical protein